MHFYVSLTGQYCVWFGLQILNVSAHPQSLRLHLEVGLQLARGEVPHCRHRVFVIKSHSAADRETTGLTENSMQKRIQARRKSSNRIDRMVKRNEDKYTVRYAQGRTCMHM